MRQLKQYLQKYRVHYGISANIHKGIRFNDAAISVQSHDMIYQPNVWYLRSEIHAIAA